jgi:streptogramin lyase
MINKLKIYRMFTKQVTAPDKYFGVNWPQFLLVAGFCLLVAFLWQGKRVATAVSSPGLNATTIYLPLVATTPIVEYDIPVDNAAPRNIAVASPGNIWVTLPGVNAVGSLVVTTTIDFEFTLYPVPTPNSEPHDLVFDAANGAVWFTQRAVDQIGRLDTTTSQIDEYPLPTGSQPNGIALAGNGLLWLSLPGTNQIASFNPANNTVSPVTYQTAGAQFTEIAVASNGIVWAVAPALNRLVTYNPTNGVFVNVFVGDFGSPTVPPHSIVMQGNTPWITVPTRGWIGRYSPGTLNLWFWYTTPPSASGPTALAHRSLGTSQEFWYVQPSNNRAGQMVIDSQGRLTSQAMIGLPTTNSQPQGIAVDTNGHAWIASTNANSIVQWWLP